MRDPIDYGRARHKELPTAALVALILLVSLALFAAFAALLIVAGRGGLITD